MSQWAGADCQLPLRLKQWQLSLHAKLKPRFPEKIRNLYLVNLQIRCYTFKNSPARGDKRAMQATHTDTMTGQICAPQTLLTLYLAVSTRLYREGLQQALGNSLHLNVVGASGNISAVVQEVNTLRPDIVLVDVSVDGFLASIASIRPARASTRIVALAVPDAPDSAIACAEAGVSGYVTRDGSIEDLARIILSAHAGEFECSPSVAAALALRVAERHAGAAPRLNLNCLTQRELQIIRLLEQGLSNKAIARDLSITVPTVKNHVHNIIEKLHVRGRCQAAALYRRLTLLASPL